MLFKNFREKIHGKYLIFIINYNKYNKYLIEVIDVDIN